MVGVANSTCFRSYDKVNSHSLSVLSEKIIKLFKRAVRTTHGSNPQGSPTRVPVALWGSIPKGYSDPNSGCSFALVSTYAGSNQMGSYAGREDDKRNVSESAISPSDICYNVQCRRLNT